MPRILISHSFPGQTEENYKNAVRLAGGEPVGGYLPKYAESCGGLLLCGGEDVSPSYYGQKNTACRGIDKLRDKAEFDLIESFVRAGKPILGVCRGNQVINVWFGGSLIQDIGDEAAMRHGTIDSLDNAHDISIREGTLLHDLCGKEIFVNSSHHQAADFPGRGITYTAYSPDGIVEALEHESLPVLGLQYHPERMLLSPDKFSREASLAPFLWLVKACR